MLLNYYCVAVAVLVGAVSGIVSVRWLRAGLRSGRVVGRAAGVGFVGTVLSSVGALLITGVDGFSLIHVAYVVGTVGVPLAGGIVLLRARPRPRAITAACVIAVAAIPVGVYATYVEPFWLKVDAVELAVDDVDERIRIGVLADLQTTAIGDYERDATERLLGFAPDIVLVPGDLYQFDAELLDERAPQFTQLIERIVDDVPLVYLVSGNTDTVAGLRQITEGTGARVLDNEIDTFELKGRLGEHRRHDAVRRRRGGSADGKAARGQRASRSADPRRAQAGRHRVGASDACRSSGCRPHPRWAGLVADLRPAADVCRACRGTSPQAGCMSWTGHRSMCRPAWAASAATPRSSDSVSAPRSGSSTS